MRRRWQWQYSRDDIVFAAGIAGGVWVMGGMIVWAVIAGLTADRYDNMTGTGYTALAIWGIPIGVAAASALIYGFAYVVIHLWRRPPLRRVSEPVREDLRRAARRDHPQP